jgi:hypothetical protein
MVSLGVATQLVCVWVVWGIPWSCSRVFFDDPAAVTGGQGLEMEQAILRTGQRVASALPGVQQWEGLKLKANQPLTKRP